MNNEDFYSADFTNSLPPALKNDPDMMALAQTISAQLQTTAAEVRKNIIYARKGIWNEERKRIEC